MLDGKLHRNRIRILIGVVICIGALVIFRLFSLQVINRTFYKEKAERQYVTPAGGVFDRGNIYFSNKDGTTVAAASVVNGFKVAIVPNQIVDPERTYELINRVLPIDHDEFMTKVAKKKDPYEEIADRVTEDKAPLITALELPGVTLYRDKWRVYPGGNLASKAIGFVSYKGDNLVGNYGLEEYYNSTLSRTSGGRYVNFFAEIFANVQSSIFKNTAVNGDIITSIEPSVQAELEHEVAEVERVWGSDSVGGIVMDPYTGEIIAMAQVPGFDLNEYGKVKNVSIFSNPFAQNVYEMGSIVKPLVMAAALDTGAVTPMTSYNDSGNVTINGATLNNFDKKGRGHVNMQDVLNQSLNTGMIFVEQHLGKDKFKDYMVNKYKLGEKTGIDLPGEVNGRMGSLNGSNDINYAAASFGQGIATSPINIVRGFGILANGGTLVTPHIATAVIEGDGSVTPFEYPHSDPVLKPETISTIRNMLVHVVDDGYHKGMEHYSVAAKTGTAQIAKSDGTGYYTDRNLHSLIGFFPASKPRYVVYFFNVYPKGALFAIQTLADPFFDTIQFLANYYQIAPDR